MASICWSDRTAARAGSCARCAGGRRRDLGLGSVAKRDLAQAREAARELRRICLAEAPPPRSFAGARLQHLKQGPPPLAPTFPCSGDRGPRRAARLVAERQARGAVAGQPRKLRLPADRRPAGRCHGRRTRCARRAGAHLAGEARDGAPYPPAHRRHPRLELCQGLPGDRAADALAVADAASPAQAEGPFRGDALPRRSRLCRRAARRPPEHGTHCARVPDPDRRPLGRDPRGDLARDRSQGGDMDRSRPSG